jgi:hypothetical protein
VNTLGSEQVSEDSSCSLLTTTASGRAGQPGFPTGHVPQVGLGGTGRGRRCRQTREPGSGAGGGTAQVRKAGGQPRAPVHGFWGRSGLLLERAWGALEGLGALAARSRRPQPPAAEARRGAPIRSPAPQDPRPRMGPDSSPFPCTSLPPLQIVGRLQQHLDVHPNRRRHSAPGAGATGPTPTVHGLAFAAGHPRPSVDLLRGAGLKKPL